MLGHSGVVIYVGQSRKLRSRLLSYFRARGRRSKAARILRNAIAIEWDYSNTIFGAQLRELRQIKKYRPRFNSVMVSDDFPRAYVALIGGVAPGLCVVRQSDSPDAMAMFGPFRRVRQLESAVRVLAETMRLRDCPGDGMKRLASCMRFELGTCPGPCHGVDVPSSYANEFKQTRAFLEGRSSEPLRRLEAAMIEASDAMAFERAASIRDKLSLLRWLSDRVGRFRADVDRLTFCYRETNQEGEEWLYLIRRGTVRAELKAPSSDAERKEFDSMVMRVFNEPDPKGRDIPTHDIDEFFLVASWFRRLDRGTTGIHGEVLPISL